MYTCYSWYALHRHPPRSARRLYASTYVPEPDVLPDRDFSVIKGHTLRKPRRRILQSNQLTENQMFQVTGTSENNNYTRT
jgi:hypothetical protein